MAYLEFSPDRVGFFDPKSMKDKGVELCETYCNAAPFPHIQIDDFVPEGMLEKCIEHFPTAPDPQSQSFDRSQERFKTSYHPDYLHPELRSFFYSLNSLPFIKFLENMTGITGLMPDPYFMGGGFHQTTNGGHLDVHADFNMHGRLKVERRLNLLLYLNKDWQPDFGGELELWDEQMESCQRRISPMFNRCVVFSTDEKSFHGHPIPVDHPRNTPRRSIALYYYTATFDATKRKYSTQFKTRPDSNDKTDWAVRRNELIHDLLPPIVARQAARISKKLFKS